MYFVQKMLELIEKKNKIWMHSSLSKLTLIVFIMELTHLSLEASNYVASM